MSSNPVGVFTTDRDLLVQVWDSTLARFTGISSSAAAGQSLLTLIPDLETRGLLGHFHRVLENGVVEVLAPVFHGYLIPCSPQEPSPHFDKMRQRVIIAPLEQGGRVAGLLVTIEDVTERLTQERRDTERLRKSSPGDSGALLEALDHGNWRVRKEAADELSRREAPDAIAALLLSVRNNHSNFGLLNSALRVLRLTNIDTHSALVDLLSADDPDLRMQAALALGEQNDPRSIPPLMGVLEDVNPNVVYHAIEALGKLRATEATGALIRFAESGDFFFGFPALIALGEIGNPEVAARLVPLLQDPALREPAAQTLGRIGDESVVEPLVNLLSSRDAPTEILATAIASLHDRFETLHGEGEYIAEVCARSMRPEGTQNLVDALKRVVPDQLRPLVLILGWVNSGAAARGIAQHLGSPAVAMDVVDALVRHGACVVELLVEQLGSEDLEVRRSAVVALGRIQDKRAIAALTDLLHRDEELLIPVISALTAIGDPEALEGMFTLMATPDAAVRRAVVSAFNTLGSPRVIQRVVALLESKDAGIREAAVRIAGYFGYREAVEPIFRCCEDPSESVRRAAIEHLPYLNDPRTPRVLAQALKKEVAPVRAAAAQAFAHLEPSEADPWLIAALEDPDPWVRYFASRSLELHRARESAPALQRIANTDKFQQVRIAALEALSKIDRDRAVIVAQEFASSSDSDLRNAADVVLGGSEPQ